MKAAGGFIGALPGMEAFGQQVSNLAPALAPILSWAEAIPAAFLAAAFAANFLADALGVVLAVVGDLVAPVAVVAGLLGGLGAAFVIGAKRAEQGGGKLSEFSQKLDMLKSMFGHTSDVLAHDFLPLLMRLAGDAQHALSFIDRLAHMPLAQAMRTAAREGIPAIQKFLDQVGHMLAKPIRLAIEIAFGRTKAGNEASSFVSNLWHQLENFWLGYTRTRTLRFGNGRVLEITQQQVSGALQPFIDWFNRHNFTAQGQKIGDQILAGVAKIAGPLSSALGHIFLAAGKKSFEDLFSVLNHPLLKMGPTKQVLDAIGKAAVATWRYDSNELKRMLGGAFLVVAKLGRNAWDDIKQDASGVLHGIASIARTQASAMATVTRHLLSDAWDTVRHLASSAWNAIRGAATGAISSIAGRIRGTLSAAWNAVEAAARRVWNFITGLFSHVLSINISWPSPPSWLTSLLNKGGSLLGDIPHPSVSLPSVAANVAGGGVVHVTNVHVHGSVIDTVGLDRAVRKAARISGRRGNGRTDILERIPLVNS